eukprot:SAG31_NODE_5888_length_2273_cov_1.429163_3_plen_282_part_00
MPMPGSTKALADGDWGGGLLLPSEIDEAVQHLDEKGFVLLKNRIPRRVALDLASVLLSKHEAARPAQLHPASFQLLFGCFNVHHETWQYMPAHPDTLRVAQALLGPSCRAIEGICGRTLPGATSGGLHRDCAQDFKILPRVECCWGVNAIWMLTDFTPVRMASPSVTLAAAARDSIQLPADAVSTMPHAHRCACAIPQENGATRLLPGSHRECTARQRDEECAAGAATAIPVLGEAGDVFLWHMGTLHQSGANHSSGTRVSFNCGYVSGDNLIAAIGDALF